MNSSFIIDNLIYFISGTIFFLVVSAITGKKYRANEKKVLQKISNDFSFQKNKTGKLKGIYKGKEAVIYYENDGMFKIYNNNTVLRIKTYFFNASKFLKSKPQTFPAPCFSLYKKSEFSKKWNGFKNSFGIFKKIDLDLSEKTKLNLQDLFCKGYFSYAVASLKIWAPNSKKSMLMHKGEVVLQLPKNIAEDSSSLKIAMDIVVNVAKQMDEMQIRK